MNKNSIFLGQSLLIAVVFGLGGCYHVVLLESSAIERRNDDDIIVSTKDGRQISFDSHQYSVVSDSNGRHVLRGKGRMYRMGELQFVSFEGSIAVDDIDKISTSEKTVMFYLTLSAAALAAGYVLLWALVFHGRIQ